MSKYKDRTQLISRDERPRYKQKVFIDIDADAMLNQFMHNIENVNSRFRLYDRLISEGLKVEAEDVLRFQVVYLMSALDFYMHELYSYSLIKLFNSQKRKTYRYKEYRVPLKLVEVAVYDAENIFSHLKQTFIEINSNFTFMHPNKIKELLNIISYEDEFTIIESRLKVRKIIKDSQHLENILEDIYQRRNKISHQTDIDHGKIERSEIKKETIMWYTEVLTALVHELHQLVCTE